LKFSRNDYPPGFFDLSQDISAGLPAEIIAEWTSDVQSETAARRILERTRVSGTVVASDSAGLTRLSLRTGLIEMLALINKPKELVYSWGTHIGGESVGIWSADNTEMFYGDAIGPDLIASMLISLQKHIERECEVQIGLAAHHGEFYALSGGMYGAEADWIEDVAENNTSGGEVVFTGQFVQMLTAAHAFALKERPELSAGLGRVFRLLDGPGLAATPAMKASYPIPFSKSFYDELVAFEQSGDQALLENMYAKYTRRTGIVLVERERDDAPGNEVRLLNDLALSVVVRNMVRDLLAEHRGEEIKTAGNLGIYVFDECKRAVAFAQDCREKLAQAGLRSKIGIDSGEVLIFDTPDGPRDIAGMPVNRASKIAQDCGEFGNIYLSNSAAAEAGSEGFQPIEVEVSGVRLESWVRSA
jgi:class 3 adenylate cyclase